MSTAKNTARAARSSTFFRRAARAGYAVLGVVHVLIGTLAVSIALGAGGDADQDGAMEQIHRTPIGGALLWCVAAGLIALAAWQITAAVVAAAPDEAKRWGRRVTLLGAAVAYLVIAGMAAVYAVGGSADSEEATQTLSARVMAAPGGLVLIVLLGIGVIGVGVGFVVGGLRRVFEKTMDLPDGGARNGVVTLGVIGYIAKGVAVALTGALFVVAAWTQDPDKAAGLDAALHSLAALPLGRLALLLTGAGLAVYGLFCFARARLARM